MNNGSNNWEVKYSSITWLEDALKTHKNVLNIERHDDIIFEVLRKKGSPITLICLDEYTMGKAAVQRVLIEFPDVNYIYVGGFWNSYTSDAYKICLKSKIGIGNSKDLTGSIWKNDFWNYKKPTKD